MDDPIDQLLGRCLEQPEAEWRAAVEAACTSHPAQATELRRRFAQIQQMSAPELPVPDQIPERLGEFRILRRLGGGGMGVVFLAEQEPLGRTVALKLIRPDQLYFPGARERFRREVEAAARLNHPGIVPVYTVGEAGALPYFAMEHVPGASLEQVVRALPEVPAASLTGASFAQALAQASGAEVSVARTGSWTEVCLRLVLQVAEALAHAHDRGVLHRDIKPSNIMVTSRGECRLLDFGLAVGPGASRLTRTGAQMGSLPFMSPEQVAGRFDQVDRRSDLYSLGVTLYELLTRKLPFRAETNGQLVRAIGEQDARDPRALNPAVTRDQSAVVLKVLEKDPARRYQTAFALAEDLRALLEHRPVAARPIGRAERGLRWARREPAWATVLALLVLAVPVAAGVLGYFAATREAAAVGRAKQRDDRIERVLARGFTAILVHGRVIDDAERAFREVLALDPGNLDAMIGLALMHMSAGGGAQTLSFLDGEARSLAGRAAFQRMRAMALASLGRNEEARAVRRQEPQPEGIAEQRLLAELSTQEAWTLADAQLEREALAQVSDVILLSREARLLPYARQAQLAARHGDERLTRRTVAALQLLWPDERLVDFVVGSALIRFDPKVAVDALRRYLAGGAESGALVNLSTALEACGEDAEALARAEQALAVDPESLQVQARMARALRRVGRVAEAVPYLIATIRNPSNSQAPNGLMDLVGVLQDAGPKAFPEARQLVVTLAQARPQVFELQANAGALLGAAGRVDEALLFLRRAVALRPDSVEALVSLGAACKARNEPREAEQVLRRALAINPGHFVAHYNLGVLLMAAADYPGALAEYRAALAIRDDAQARNNLGMMLGRLEGPEAAIVEFRRAIALDPTLRPAHTNLLRQLGKLGDQAGIAEEEARWERATSRPASRR